MKDSVRIVQYIDQCIEAFLEEPQSCALNAETLECLFRELDCLRQFILDDELEEGEVSLRSTYHQFLLRGGYGVGLITSDRSKPVHPMDVHNDPKLAKLRAEWARYLKNREKYLPPTYSTFHHPWYSVSPWDVQTGDGLRLDGVLVLNSTPLDKSLGVDGLLCLHGTGSNFYASVFYNGLVPHLNKAGPKIWRVNTRGHDLIATSAGKLHGSAYERVADCVLDLRAWLGELGRHFKRIALVGHSLGALKGIYALAREEFPEITRLIAVSPPWLSYERFSTGRKRELFLETLAEAQGLVEAGRGETLMEVLFPLPYVVTAAGYVDKYGQEERYNVSDLIGAVKIPTLVTFGTEELGAGGPFHGLPEEISRLAAEGATNAQVRVIEGANHQYLDRHEALAEVVLGWLRANA